MKYKRQFILLLIFFASISCVKDVDFDQIEDVSIEPTYMASLIYFNLDQHSFLDVNNTEIPTATDRSITPIFEAPNTENFLVRAVFYFEIDNSFDRDFEIQYTFLDRNDVVTRVFQPMEIPSNVTNFTYTEVIQQNEIASVLPSYFSEIEVTLQNGTPLNPNQNSSLHFKSSVIFYYNVTAE